MFVFFDIVEEAQHASSSEKSNPEKTIVPPSYYSLISVITSVCGLFSPLANNLTCTTHRQHIPMFRISLRTLVIITVICVAVIAAIIALLPLYYKAFASAEDTARLFAETVTAYLASEMTGLTQRIDTGLDTVGNSLHRLCVNLSDTDSVIGLIGFSFVSTNTSTSLYLDNGKYFNFAVQSVFNATISSPAPKIIGVATVGNTQLGTAEFSLRYLSNFSLATTYPNYRFTQPNTYNVSTRPFFKTLRAGRGWTAPYVDVSGLFAAQFSGMPVFDGFDTQTYVGAVGIKLVVENNVIAFAKTIKVAKTGRILLVDGPTGTHFGGNTDDPSIIKMANATLRLATIDDSTDPVIQAAIHMLPGGSNTLLTCVTPCSLSQTHRTGDMGFFIRVESIVNHTSGLTMRSVVIIPATDFLGDISSGSRISIIATACAIVALIIISAIIIVVQMQPLKELHERLLTATDFTDNYDEPEGDMSGSTTSHHSDGTHLQRKQSILASSVSATQRKKLVPSRLLEIYKIQTAYISLHRELRKVKSFLPQSVLRQLEHQSANEDDVEEAGHEDVVEMIQNGDNVAAATLTNVGEPVPARQMHQIHSSSNELLLVSGASATPSGGLATSGGPAQIPGSIFVSPTTTALAGSGVGQSSSSLIGFQNPLGPQSSQSPHPQPRTLPTWVHGVSTPVVAGGNSNSTAASHTSDSGGASVRSAGDSGQTSPRHQSSQSKRRSGARKGTTVAMLARPSISIEVPLQSRRMTVLVGNVNRFHTLLDVVGAQVLQKCHAIVVDHILTAVNRSKGVLDSFFGDHFMVTFNASVACSRPAIRAARFISDASTMLLHAAAEYGDGATVPRSIHPLLGKGDEKDGSVQILDHHHHQKNREGIQNNAHAIAAAARAPWSLRIGCATGTAICGNFGSDRMRRFCAVGPVVSHANALMQQCRSEGCASAVESQTFQDASHEFSMEHVNFVVLPHAAQGGLISTVLDRQLLPQGERAAGGDGGPSRQRLEVTKLINEAFEAFARGDLASAKDLAARVPREHAGGIVKCLRSVMQSLSALSM